MSESSIYIPLPTVTARDYLEAAELVSKLKKLSEEPAQPSWESLLGMAGISVNVAQKLLLLGRYHHLLTDDELDAVKFTQALALIRQRRKEA
nr:hypothetical protein [uncultured Desulfuromonas sp.]